MWIGLLMGLLFGMVFVLFFDILEKNITIILRIFIILVSTIIGASIGCYVDNIGYQKYINSYSVKKETIEISLKSNLSDLEKIELLKQVVELNGELAENKVKYNKFFYFYLDRDKINDLEIINLEDKE